MPLHQQNLKWVGDYRMSACYAKQIQHDATRIICAPKVVALAENFEAVKLMMRG